MLRLERLTVDDVVVLPGPTVYALATQKRVSAGPIPREEVVIVRSTAVDVPRAIARDAIRHP